MAGELMTAVAEHIASAKRRALPAEVDARARLHILDTIASMISGAELPPGRLAIAYGEALGGRPQCTIVGAGYRSNPVTAASVNAMLAHADETDDSHSASLSHPGCSIVPTALAFAEHSGATLTELVRAVTLGYDIGARINLALNAYEIRELGHSTHSIGPTFGSAAAAASLAGLGGEAVRWVLSLAGQQASGLACWMRDQSHLEKAFDFGGMPARNGATAAHMVANGFTGVDDIFSGERDFFVAFDESARTGLPVRPERLIDGLGEHFELLEASIKKFTVGSPVQAPLDGVDALVNGHNLDHRDIASIHVGIAKQALKTVDSRKMTSINLQHLCAVMAIDRTVTFASSHDADRANDLVARDLASRITLAEDPRATDAMPVRQASVAITMTDGRVLEHYVDAVRGSAANPMTDIEVRAKADSLMAHLVPESEALIDLVLHGDDTPVTTLTAMLGAGA